MVASGFAIFFPAISGAEPPLGSYSPKAFSPKEAEGSIPREPVISAISSERMSPNIFSVAITEKHPGLRTSCIAIESTRAWLSFISGSCSPLAVKIFLQSRELSRTLALSTETSSPPLSFARENAILAILSISCAR